MVKWDHMADGDDREPLRDFIDKLDQRQERGLLTEQEYRSLISECRVTLTDLDTIDNLAEKHVIRARKALTQGKFETAVAELERAVTLTPMETGRRAELGRAYLARYEGRGYLARDLERAAGTARDILILKPQSREGQELKRSVEEAGGVFTRVKGKNRNWVIPLIILLILILSGITWVYRKEISLPGFLAGLGKRSGTGSETTEPLPSSEIPSWFETEPDTSLLSAEGLEVRFVTAEAKISRGAWVLDLQGTVTPTKEEFKKLTLELRWPGDNPKITREIPLIRTTDPAARPGDGVVLDAWLFLPRTPEPWNKPQLVIKERESGKPGTYPETVLVPVFFEKKAAEGTDPTLSVRTVTIAESYDRYYYPIDIEVSNNGYKPILFLDLELAAFGKGPEPDSSRRFSPVTRTGVPLEPGTKRVVRTTLRAPAEEPLDLKGLQLIVHDSGTDEPSSVP